MSRSGPWTVNLCECGRLNSDIDVMCISCSRHLKFENRIQVQRVPTPEALEGSGQARTTDPDTAKAAGAIVVNRGSQRWKILEALKQSQGGLTSGELVTETGIPYGSVTPRIGELKHGGYIRATDRTRTSQYGVQQEVLVAATQPTLVDVPDVEPEPNPDVYYDDPVRLFDE